MAALMSWLTVRKPEGFNMNAVDVRNTISIGTKVALAIGKSRSRLTASCKMSSPGKPRRCGALSAVRQTASHPATSMTASSGMPEGLDSSAIKVTQAIAHQASLCRREYQ